jgi:ABC-type uncharacterized transport system auxiliary subunit
VLKRRLAQVTLVVLSAGFLSACGASRPYKYYDLDVSSPPPQASQAQPYSVRLIVARVNVPELYRDSRLVYGSGNVQLGAYEYDRWAVMPADMLQDALITALRGTGQYRSVTRIGSRAQGDYVVRSQLFSLYGVDRPNLVGRFSMEVELFDPKSGTTLWTNTYSHDEPVNGKTVTDVVEALDRNVQAGMQQFASNLGQYFAAHPPESAR